jgi:predicted Zn-dependent protease
LKVRNEVSAAAAEFAIEKDYQRAEQVARYAVAANPGDFQERSRLVQILLNDGRRADAEVELRKAVDLSKSDPERWITLALARAFGADETVNLNDVAEVRDRMKTVRQMTDGWGADVVCEFVGHASVMSEGIQMLAPGGRYL